MKKQNLIAAGTVVLAGLTAAPALAAATGPKVTFRVEGLTRTVVPAKTVTTPGSGSITKFGVKAGACPADSAQGVLNVGTGGNWKGKYYSEYKEYEITSIAGNTPNPKKDYFEIFVNNVAASAGACDIKVKAGASVLFAAVPDSGKPETPLAVTASESGGKISAVVVAYNAKGKPSPLKGATVTVGHTSAKTAANGVATLTPSGTYTETGAVVATAPGYIRDEATVK